MDVCCSQALNGTLLWGGSQSEWIAPHFVVGMSASLCTYSMYVRLCVCVSHQTDSLGASDGPEVPRSSHAHWHQPESSTTHSLPLLSSSLIFTLSFILSLPSLLLSLSSHFVFCWFSAWPHFRENNYWMGTPCFSSDFEVNISIVLAGPFCSWCWSFHTSVHSDIALEANAVIPHWRRSWQDTLRALRLGTFCLCSDVKEWWLRRMWHSVGECQPIKFSHAKAIFVFQMFCWIAKKNVLYIFAHENHPKWLHFGD